MLEFGGIVVLGIIAQWFAWKLKIPAILPLILIGLFVGPLSTLITIDGTKWIRDDGAWLMVRLSGTEPVVRLYAEAADETTVTQLLDQGEALLP